MILLKTFMMLMKMSLVEEDVSSQAEGRYGHLVYDQGKDLKINILKSAALAILSPTPVKLKHNLQCVSWIGMC